MLGPEIPETETLDTGQDGTALITLHYYASEGPKPITLRELWLASPGWPALRPQAERCGGFWVREGRKEGAGANGLHPRRQLTSFQLVWEAAPAQLGSVFSLVLILVSSPYVTLSHQDRLHTQPAEIKGK